MGWKLREVRGEMGPLLRLALPLVLGELGWVAMSVVDTVMVGRLPHSAVAMAAASLAQVLFNVFVFGLAGVLLGLDPLIAQAFGAREVGEANRWLVHGLVMALALAALLTGIFVVGPVLLGRLPVEADVLAQAVPAMRGLNYGVLPLMLYFTLRRYLQGAHHTRPIAYALISANAINAAGDWLLIFGHRWLVAGHVVAIPAFGVTGSSWATSFSRLYLMLFVLAAVWLADRKHGYGLGRVSRRIEFAHLRELLRIGAPASASVLAEIGIFALVTTLIATLGPLPLAGHEVALQCASTTFMVPFAISAATSVRVGHHLGRMRAGLGTAAKAIAAGWAGIVAGAGAMLVCSVFFVSVPAQIARLFTPDRAVIAAAAPLLLIAAGFQFFDGIQINATGALRGAGNTTAPLYTQLVCYWCVGMPVGAWLGFRAHLGAAGLWLGLLMALTGAAVVLVWVWRRTARAWVVGMG
jgi:MATE family multidrug resistance protein